MTVAEAAERRGRATTLYRGSAFGIGITAPVALTASAHRASKGGREVLLELGSISELDGAWCPRRAERVLERRWSDGRLVMSVDHHPELGYRVYAPHNGRHLVAPDGTRIFSTRPVHARWRWERLLFAQVLPLAATLQGLELLHASAAEWNGLRFGVVGPSGAGKTSVAAHVVASGGHLVTDDVLALEESGSVAVAHPGPRSLSVHPAELARMSSSGRRRLGPRVGRAEKVVFAAKVAVEAVPLSRLYVLERPSRGRLRIEALAGDPVRLLANSFNTYVRSPERIVNQLAVLHRLVQSVPTFSVRIPSGEDAAGVARAVIAHVEAR